MKLNMELSERLSLAGQCFGALKESVFLSRHIRVETRKCFIQGESVTNLVWFFFISVTKRDILKELSGDMR